MRIDTRPLPAHLPDLGGLPPLLTRLYAARGVQNQAELSHSLAQLAPWQLLKGIDSAVELLLKARQTQQRILVIGDFDADGATASAVAILGLRALGFTQVDYLVPNRFEYGYGLSPAIVEVAKTRQPDLLITVDNGISSLEGVAAAKAAGIKVLITDHHLAAAELPEADALVNPNQPGCPFSSKALAGVGVMFYVLLALRAKLREQGEFEDKPAPNLAELLDLVALGTVADVVPLDANNRILVQQGLLRIRAGKCRLGIAALLEVAKKTQAQLHASDLGFIVGPRLNAAGRLDDISLGIECLLAEDATLAKDMAEELDSLNRDRRQIEQGMQREALAQLKELDESNLPFGLCLFDKDWHQGVIGILAARLKERYHRPTIAFANADNGELKGSARSVQGFHIREALEAVAARYPHLIEKFGGHAMAAGLSLKQENFTDFARAFDEEVRRQLNAEQLCARIDSDGTLSTEELSLALARQLHTAGPWGQQFPEPLFHGLFKIKSQRLIGERHLKLQLATLCETVAVEGIAFNIERSEWPNEQIKQVNIAYRLDINHYRGNETLQLVVVHIEPH